MTWEDIIAKKTKRGIRGAFDRRDPFGRPRSSMFYSYQEYDKDELLNIFLMILDKMTDGKAMKYYQDAKENLSEMTEDGTRDKYLKGMDEREYMLRYTLLQASRDGEEWATADARRITLSKMISKIFGEKDFKLKLE